MYITGFEGVNKKCGMYASYIKILIQGEEITIHETSEGALVISGDAAISIEPKSDNAIKIHLTAWDAALIREGHTKEPKSLIDMTDDELKAACSKV